MSRSKNRKIADLISGGTFDDGVVAASEVTGLHSVASTGNFNELSNKPAPFDPATLASVAVSGSFNDLSDQPTPFDPSTLATVATTGAYSALSGKPSLGTASTQATGAFATAAQGTLAASAVQPNTNPTFGTVSASSLTGIGSIDATTKNAIAAAGVGGATSLITSETTVSNVNSLTITLPTGYKTHIIRLRDFVLSSGNEAMFTRFGTSSGIITGVSYTYAYNGSSSDESGDRPYMRLGGKITDTSRTSAREKYASFNININDASTSNGMTYLSFTQAANVWYGWGTHHGTGYQWDKQVHTKFNLYFENSVPFSGKYEVWGVNV